VIRYSGPFPTSDDADGGCGGSDETGAPLADSVSSEVFIPGGQNNLLFPNAIVAKPDGGGFYVDSVINGVINEYDESGSFVRSVLAPPPGEVIGEQTFSTGTPLGMGIDSEGTLYYADIGITISADGIGPGPEGSVRRIRFVDGEPQPPEVMGDGLAFPDGIGVLERTR
jgi:sugar lactone lactonase YvrE